MANPLRRHDLNYDAGTGAHVLNVHLASGEEVQLTGEAAVLFLAADGTCDVDGLLARVRAEVDPECRKEDVFAALDALADAGLLEERVTPPGAGSQTTRRGLVKLLGAAAAYAVVMPLGGSASAAPGGERGPAPQGEQGQKRGRAAERYAKQERRYGPPHSEPNRKRAAEEEDKRAAEEREKKAAEQQKKKEAEQLKKKEAELGQKKEAEQVQKKEAEQKEKQSAEQQKKKKEADEQQKKEAETRLKKDAEQQKKQSL